MMAKDGLGTAMERFGTAFDEWARKPMVGAGRLREGRSGGLGLAGSDWFGWDGATPRCLPVSLS